MVEALQVRLPIADVLVVKPVNDVFAQDQVWLIHVRLPAEQARRNQVRLVNRGAFIAAADRGQDLLAQPHQVCFELRQHGGERRNSG